MFNFKIFFLTLTLIGCTNQMNKPAPRIPMEDFFRNPEKSSFRISPSGDRIAYMKPWKTRMNVFVLDMKND